MEISKHYRSGLSPSEGAPPPESQLLNICQHMTRLSKCRKKYICIVSILKSLVHVYSFPISFSKLCPGIEISKFPCIISFRYFLMCYWTFTAKDLLSGSITSCFLLRSLLPCFLFTFVGNSRLLLGQHLTFLSLSVSWRSSCLKKPFLAIFSS